MLHAAYISYSCNCAFMHECLHVCVHIDICMLASMPKSKILFDVGSLNACGFHVCRSMCTTCTYMYMLKVSGLGYTHEK